MKVAARRESVEEQTGAIWFGATPTALGGRAEASADSHSVARPAVLARPPKAVGVAPKTDGLSNRDDGQLVGTGGGARRWSTARQRSTQAAPPSQAPITSVGKQMPM